MVRAPPRLLIWCSTCGRDSYKDTCDTCQKIYDEYGKECERTIQMAKKKSKKKSSSKKTATPTAAVVGAAPPQAMEDTRVDGLQTIAESISTYNMGDMDERFATAMGKLATEIGKVADRLAKALEVQAVANAKKAALKAKLLARAEAL